MHRRKQLQHLSTQYNQRVLRSRSAKPTLNQIILLSLESSLSMRSSERIYEQMSHDDQVTRTCFRTMFSKLYSPTAPLGLPKMPPICSVSSKVGSVVEWSKRRAISLLNYKRTAMSWYLRKQVGVIAYPMH